MTEGLGQAELELTTDQSKLNKGLDDARRKSKGFLDDVGKSYKSVSSSIFQGIGQGLGQAAFGLVKQGIGAIAGAVTGAVSAASDLRESMSLTSQVFEGSTDDMAKWAEGAAHAFGQSQREALNFASAFGTTFKNVGFALDETAEKSKIMTRLAADLGSAFNRSSDEAATALRSGLLGESEPLRAFGVFLSEAAVQAKAVELGIAKVGAVLTNNQKVTARYAIIMQQTADSQGMFGRDTDSLADAQKTLAAVTENLGAKLGQKLLPFMTAGAKAATDLVEHFDEIAPIIAGVGAAIVAVMLPALARMAVAAIAATGPFAPLAALLVALGVAMASGAKTADEYRAKLAEFESDTGWGRNQGVIDALKRKIEELDAAEKKAAEEQAANVAWLRKTWTESGIPQAVGGVVDGVAKELATGKYVIKDGALVMAAEIPHAVKTQGILAVRAVEKSIDDMAREIRAGRQVIVDAMTGVVTDAYDPLILAADIAATRVELAEARKVAASKKTGTVERKEAARRVLELERTLGIQLADQTRFGTDAERLARLTGRATSKELVAGLKSGDKARRAASQAAAADIASGILALERSAGKYGTRTGNAYVDHLVTRLEQGGADIGHALRGIRGAMAAFSPPGPESPLHDIDKWGRRTGEAWINPLIEAITAARATLRGVVGGIGADLVIPGGGLGDLARRALRGATAGMGVGGVTERAGALAAPTLITNNRTNTFHISLAGAHSTDPFEVPRQLRRLAEAGTFDR